MPRPRAPWWMFLLAASFLVYFAVIVYNDFWGPEPLGTSSSDDSGTLVIMKIDPRFAAARAGFKVGDNIVSIDGHPIRNLMDWMVSRANFEPSSHHVVGIIRGQERRELSLDLGRTNRFKFSDFEFVSITLMGSRLFILALALVIAFSKPNDLIARVGSWLLASLSVANPTLPYG